MEALQSLESSDVELNAYLNDLTAAASNPSPSLQHQDELSLDMTWEKLFAGEKVASTFSAPNTSLDAGKKMPQTVPSSISETTGNMFQNGSGDALSDFNASMALGGVLPADVLALQQQQQQQQMLAAHMMTSPWAMAAAAAAMSNATLQTKLPIHRLPSQDTVHVPTRHEKKAAHNLIERRYRNSINDRINQLKSILPCGKAAAAAGLPEACVSAKANKASILGRAIAYIQFLEETNRRLIQDANAASRPLPANVTALNATSSPSGESISTVSDEDEWDRDDRSVKRQKLSSSASTSPSSDNSTVSSPSSQSGSGRVLMAIMIMACFFVNPVSLIQSSSESLPNAGVGNDVYETQRIRTRVLSSTSTAESSSIPLWSWSSILLDDWVVMSLWSFVRAVIALFCLVRIFRAEPVTLPGSRAAKRAFAFLVQAEEHCRKGERAAAHRMLSNTLSVLGRPLPTSLLDLSVGILWQTIRQFLHRAYIGLWMEARSTTTDDSDNDTMIVAASAYHRLHELSLTFPLKSSRLHSLYFVLASLNLAEVADSTACLLTTIYATVSIHSLAMFPSIVGRIVSGYFVKLCSNLVARASKEDDWEKYEIDDEDVNAGPLALLGGELAWLLSEEGYSFLSSKEWCSELNGSDMSFSPLVSIGSMYRRKLLQEGLLAFFDPTPVNTGPSALLLFEEVQVLATSARDDPALHLGILCAALVYRRSGRVEEARSYLNAAKEVHCSKSAPDHALLAALTAADSWDNDDLASCEEAVNRAALLLKESITLGVKDKLSKAVLFSAVNVVLTTRLALASRSHRNGSDNDCRNSIVSALRSDMATLRRLSESMPFAESRLQLYTAMIRALAGSNAARTFAGLRQAAAVAKHRGWSYEHAQCLIHTASLLGGNCNFLSISETRNLLTEARHIFAYIGATNDEKKCCALLWDLENERKK